MGADIIRYRREEGIAVLEIAETIDTHGKMTMLAREIGPICSDLSVENDLRVVILGGVADSAFSMGEPLLRDMESLSENATDVSYSIAGEIAAMNRPVIAAIQGDAVGLGLELALACDLRVSSDTSRFGLPHLNFGLIPWDGGTQRLSRLVGQGKAMEMTLTGEMIDAAEAGRIGLVNRIVSRKDLHNYVWDMARRLAAGAPISIAYTREAIGRGMDLTLQQGLSLEADLYFLLHTTRDRREGITAFQEKRTPRFIGE